MLVGNPTRTGRAEAGWSLSSLACHVPGTLRRAPQFANWERRNLPPPASKGEAAAPLRAPLLVVVAPIPGSRLGKVWTGAHGYRWRSGTRRAQGVSSLAAALWVWWPCFSTWHTRTTVRTRGKTRQIARRMLWLRVLIGHMACEVTCSKAWFDHGSQLPVGAVACVMLIKVPLE
jgi:hypothetical protein